MNLVLFLLSFLFASYAPTTQTTSDDGDNSTTTAKHHKAGKTKTGNSGGEFIISYDYP